MKHFQQFKMDETTWRATVGAGTLLGDLTKRMHDAGGRAMAHGTCPQVNSPLSPVHRQRSNPFIRSDSVVTQLSVDLVPRPECGEHPSIISRKSKSSSQTAPSYAPPPRKTQTYSGHVAVLLLGLVLSRNSSFVRNQNQENVSNFHLRSRFGRTLLSLLHSRNGNGSSATPT